MGRLSTAWRSLRTVFVRHSSVIPLGLTTPVSAERTTEALSLGAGGLIDGDEHLYRRLTSGGKFAQRDLAPIQQDRMLEIAWYLWETNPFAKRIVTLTTDLVVGEGVKPEAKDPRVQEVLDKTWTHRINRLDQTIRELHNGLAMNGELILPVERNPISGIPVIGYIDPYQVQTVRMRADNARVPEAVILKPTPGQSTGLELKIVAEDPISGLLDGEVFYFGINKPPNGSRGRSDYLPIADWLDLFDQLMFAEVERVQLLSAFVYDLQMKGSDTKAIQKRLKELGTPKPGSVFGHNENETLAVVTPDLKAHDRSETARLLTIHIAGNSGIPLAWLGYEGSNRATVDATNDVLMKTPAARQKEFGGFLNQILRFAVEGALTKNPVLYRGAVPDFGVVMPEISAKDIARVGGVIAQVTTAMDTAIANKTLPRRAATLVQVALVKHLGIDLGSAQDLLDEADEEGDGRGVTPEMMAALARARAAKAAEPAPEDVAGVDGEEAPAA